MVCARMPYVATVDEKHKHTNNHMGSERAQ